METPIRSTLFGVALLCAAAFSSAAELPAEVLEQLRAAGIPATAVGVMVQRGTDGTPLFEHQSRVPMQPASTLKLLTAMVALEQLGPAYRGKTELAIEGDVARGVLKGNAYLRGFGDVDFDWHALERMLHRLRNLGIREIRGDLVLDLTFFEPARMDVGLPPFDEAPEFRYNVIPDALGLNMNLLELDLVADSQRVNARLMTPLEGVSIQSGLALKDGDCDDWDDDWKIPSVERKAGGRLDIALRGVYPRNCSTSTALNLMDRVEFAERLFRALWGRMGGKFHGKVREGTTPPSARIVAEHRSRPLAQVLHDIEKRSDNPVTRVIFLTLGALSSAPSGEPTARRSEAQVRAWLERRGIDHKGLVLENGSGLSRNERVTPAQLAALLQAARASDWSPEFAAALPIVALDGGMRKRLRTSPAASRSRIKTGTLRDSTAVAGYVTSDAGESYNMVAIIDHPLAKRKVARPIVDAIIDWAARGLPR
jgi:serine-type D-Ala-D-Ala carboxypeptidase/endopeptidase (penicillin-binding protein 4)